MAPAEEISIIVTALDQATKILADTSKAVTGVGTASTGTDKAMAGSQRSHVSAVTPLGRAGAPDDIARAVLFFASPLASYVSGQMLLVDGGASAIFPLGVPGR